MLTILFPVRTSPIIGGLIDEVKGLTIETKIVVVGHSTPKGTRETVLSKGGIYLDEPKRGKGIAVTNALKELDTEYMVMLDSDGTYPINQIPEFLTLLNTFDVVIGNRKFREVGSMTLTNRVGNFLLSLLASILYGYWIKDVCSGMWGFRVNKIREFNLTSIGFTLEADLFVNSIRTGCRVGQLPIEYKVREDSKPNLKVRDGFRIAWFLIKRRVGRV